MFVGIGVGVGRQRVSGGAFVGLLDLYPSASVAYSLRKLSSTYTGNAIRVRRASDNTEQNIGFDALGNLDTTALTSFCSGTNGFVTTWYDQSGNGSNVTQPTANLQARIVSGGVYSGFADFSVNSNCYYDTPVAYGISQTWTTFQVGQSVGQYSCYGGGGTASGWFYGVAENGSTASSWASIQPTYYYANSVLLPNFTRDTLYDAMSTSLTTLTSLVTSGAGARDIRLAYPFGFSKQYFCEFVGYNSNKSSDRSAIELNQQNYW